MQKGSNLRIEKLKLRDQLDTEERKLSSDIIQKNLLRLESVQSASTIFIYVSFRSEADTFGVLHELLRLEKLVSVPITHVKAKRMDAIQIVNIENDLTPGYCGILEPNKKRQAESIMPPDKIDVVVVPGSVFDEKGGRFGYGGGYYDRFLEKIPEALRIGLAFEVQMVKKLPLQRHDQLLDVIITEKRIINNIR